jgi:UDP-N-acetylglucosamine--N-acetylmuramyl-(pentapeptide) pyrophosphoryl-undecaprenol N-acetylglucosamine transferase
LLSKPVILVPSPNVAEDHQTKNAMALVQKDAALMVRDTEAVQNLVPLALKTIQDDEILHSLSSHILTLAEPDSADRIVEQIVQVITKKQKL